MARKPEPPKPTSWTVYKLAAKAIRLGTVEAPDEATAIERGAAEFKVPASRLMADACQCACLVAWHQLAHGWDVQQRF
jgi:hypothetical protein